jgi:hypothetical protein
LITIAKRLLQQNLPKPEVSRCSYRQLGKDPDQIIAAALQALASRFNLQWGYE